MWKRVRRLRLGAQVGITVAVLGLLVASWHYWTIYSSLTTAKTSLLGIETGLADSGLDAGTEEIADARRSVDIADVHLRRARSHIRWDPLFAVMRHAPVLGDQIQATDELLDMAQIIVEIGREGTVIGDRAVQMRERPPTAQPLTQSLVELLNETAPQFTNVEALTARLVEKRLALGDRRLLPPLDSIRTSLDQKLPEVADTIEQAQMVRSLLPGLLGFDGERRYLVLALNDAELLPGGGLVTAAAVVPVTGGKHGDMDFSDSTTWKARWEAKGGTYIEPPEPLARYLLRGFTWNLLVSNWSPDFPTWSQEALEFYEMVHGPQDVDGVVAVDLEVLRRLLTVTGPKTIDVQGSGPVTFDSTNAVLEMERLTRQPFEPGDDRKSIIGELASAVISDLLSLPSERWAATVTVIRALGDEQHVQLFMRSAGEQTLVRGIAWDGRLHTDVTGDYLHFNEASVNSTKLNLIIRPEGALDIDVDDQGAASHELRLTYRNPFPEWAKGKDPKLVEQLMLGGVYGGYLRVFVPAGANGFSVEIDGQAAIVEDVGTELGRAWYGVFLPLMPGATAAVTMRWDVTAVSSLPGSAEYSLFLEKQPGTPGLCLKLSVSQQGTAPERMAVNGGMRDAAGRVCLTTDVELTATFR